MIPQRLTKLIRIALLSTVAIGLVLLTAHTTSADPSFGTDPASVSGPPGDVLEPAPGSPQLGPLPAPISVIGAPALGLPAVSNVDALSYGNDPFPAPAPWHLVFSVNPAAAGHPLSPPISPLHPNVTLEVAAGDGSAQGDLYSSFSLPGVPATFGAFPPGPPAPCAPPAIDSNIQVADENGAPPLALAPNVGLGLLPGVDNLDTLDVSDNSFVDFAPAGGDGLPDAPVFFSVDGPTAALLPPLPPFFVPITPGTILVWDPGTAALYDWATPAMLGLAAGDDIDALAVSYVSGAAIPAGWGGPPDAVLFSLAPGSPSLPGIGSVCFGPGTGTAGDLYGKVLPVGLPIPWVDAEMLGLSTLRTGGPGDDNVDAIDIVPASAVDGDGDLLDDAADMDDDEDGLGDTGDAAAGCSPVLADTDGDTLSDYDEVITYGTNCAAADTDGDGVADNDELFVYGTDPLVVDTDGDGCADGEELGPDETMGGLRDPLSPWDFYDVAIAGAIQGQDGYIDLANDILSVAMRYTAGGGIYSAWYDRSNPPGGDPWDTGPPDGTIDLPNDIFGVAFQYHHDCRPAP